VAAPPGARIPFVGLTGGLGAGKSEALRALGELGAATLSTDALTHDLLETEEVRDLLVERLGPEAAPGGRVDRNVVAERVFGDDDARAWLESVLWPRVGGRVAEWRAELEQLDPRPAAAIVEVPLLFESGMDAVFDSTIAVIADEDVRAERAAARGHAAVGSRDGRQMKQADKAARADVVVPNDGTLEDLRVKLSHVLATIGA
jgi:dephospho-CoA kinase